MTARSFLSGLECRACCTTVEPDRLIGVCPTCGHTLLATYDLEGARAVLAPAGWTARPGGMWRYRELLPVRSADSVVTLGEPESPVLRLTLPDLAPDVDLWAKNDGALPTGAFKSREMSVALSRARELGARAVFLPSTGNAAVAAAAYGARARMEVRVYLTEDSAPELAATCRAFGAHVRTVRGTISDARAAALDQEPGRGSVELSTMREPYRLEGTKTMAFEVFDRFGADGLPDVIVYPTGGGLGLAGMFKAFTELRALGWIEAIPRLIAVQAAECAPLVRALRDGSPRAEAWPGPIEFLGGLTVPAPFASERVLEAVRWSGGAGVAVPSARIHATERLVARTTGIVSGFEGAATFAALPAILKEGLVRPGERVMLYLTGGGISVAIPRLAERAEAPGLPTRS
jgi:threonine synthase